ncbi:polysaccharide deacetylase family protein [Collinsella sp. zg1085]|uniref:polysaccharide deacetylase family protein n=1 Tax=Collinsella sp. zg1085 TaxID=2844380 RepID=UPI001C0DB3F6|nr:polysaccharide deacetylase family protein [Collinsella sp. zg1085]QWT17788.1 polysaccharide deacetylase family protein [Collinsella sp. zg1085]
MDKNIKIGKASKLHFGKGMLGSGPHPHKRLDTSKLSQGLSGGAHMRPADEAPNTGAQAPIAHTQHAPSPSIAGVKRVVASRPKNYMPESGMSQGATRVVAIIAFVAMAVIIGVFCWWMFWRDVTFTINEQQLSARVGTPLADIIKEHDNFGAKPGRLLSVGGTVLDEAGGSLYTVNVGKEDMPASKLGSLKIADNMKATVANGIDTTEEHDEEEVLIPPAVEMQRGGAVQFVSQWGKSGKKLVWTGKTSGEKVDHETVEDPQTMVISSKNLIPAEDGKKYMALTFDDGPSKFTPAILDILKEKGVKATFFELGTNITTYAKYSKRVLDEGHQLASHSNVHAYLPKLDKTAMREDLTAAFTALKEATGLETQMFRAPYGAFDTNSWLKTYDLVSSNVLWNIDTLDWKRPGAAAITRAVVNGAQNGAIVLMHDGGGDRSQDVEALPGIIDQLKAAGYELVTVEELMKLDKSLPEDVIASKIKLPAGVVIPEDIP